jgi:hypothetical protein
MLRCVQIHCWDNCRTDSRGSRTESCVLSESAWLPSKVFRSTKISYTTKEFWDDSKLARISSISLKTMKYAQEQRISYSNGPQQMCKMRHISQSIRAGSHGTSISGIVAIRKLTHNHTFSEASYRHHWNLMTPSSTL